MKIGMNLWTIYGWELPELPSEQVLAAIAAMDVEAVELVVDESLNSVEELLTREREIKALLAQHHLSVPFVASALFWRYNLGSQDDAVRSHGVSIIQGMCKVAATYGASAILVVAGQQEPHTPYKLTWDNAVRSVRAAARAAEELGVLIGVENVGTSFLHTPGEMANFIADVDHPYVGSYLDLGNSMYGSSGYPENWCTALVGRIHAVHVKDHDPKGGGYTYCGEGDLRWAEVLPVLRACGYDRELIVETPNKEASGIEAGLDAARRSVTGLRGFLA